MSEQLNRRMSNRRWHARDTQVTRSWSEKLKKSKALKKFPSDLVNTALKDILQSLNGMSRINIARFPNPDKKIVFMRWGQLNAPASSWIQLYRNEGYEVRLTDQLDRHIKASFFLHFQFHYVHLCTIYSLGIVSQNTGWSYAIFPVLYLICKYVIKLVKKDKNARQLNTWRYRFESD